MGRKRSEFLLFQPENKQAGKFSHTLRCRLETGRYQHGTGLQNDAPDILRNRKDQKSPAGHISHELAKLFNRPLSVYDQAKDKWYTWKQGAWVPENPKISHDTFVGSGTRNLSENGRQAISRLFEEAFGAE